MNRIQSPIPMNLEDKPEMTQEKSCPIESQWKQELLNSYTSGTDLAKAGIITELEAARLGKVSELFKIRITPYYANLISSDPACPIRLQAIPQTQEEDPEFPQWVKHWSEKLYQKPSPMSNDAIGDIRNLAAPRITHRYPQRAILHLSSLCAMYCRFCFRKTHLNDQDRTLYDGSLDEAFAYLKTHTEIEELILTGGDPLSVTDEALRRVFERVSEIKNIKVVRIHSKMAVTLPARFNSSLLSILSKDWGFQLILVSHFNHPKELTPLAKEKIKALKKTGVTLLNQSVLLRRVNDSATTLEALFQGLYQIGVIPYYLHHPDWTAGTFHFRLSIEQGRTLMRALRGRLSGPALPDYILDIPGGYGKISLLDESSCKKLQDLERDCPSEISGSLYELTPPHTRIDSIHSPILYLDLSHRMKPSKHLTSLTTSAPLEAYANTAD